MEREARDMVWHSHHRMERERVLQREREWERERGLMRPASTLLDQQPMMQETWVMLGKTPGKDVRHVERTTDRRDTTHSEDHLQQQPACDVSPNAIDSETSPRAVCESSARDPAILLSIPRLGLKSSSPEPDVQQQCPGSHGDELRRRTEARAPVNVLEPGNVCIAAPGRIPSRPAFDREDYDSEHNGRATSQVAVMPSSLSSSQAQLHWGTHDASSASPEARQLSGAVTPLNGGHDPLQNPPTLSLIGHCPSTTDSQPALHSRVKAEADLGQMTIDRTQASRLHDSPPHVFIERPRVHILHGRPDSPVEVFACVVYVSNEYPVGKI